MVLKADQERVRTLLRDTITLLCKNGLTFKSKFSIDAVIGVTLDEEDAFYVSMNEIVKSDIAPAEQPSSSEEEYSPQKRPLDGVHHKRRKRQRHSGHQFGPGASSGSEDEHDENSMLGQEDSNQGDDSNTFNGAKRLNIKGVKEENDDTGDDIMFIKQELSESWTDPGGQFTGGVQSDTSTFMSPSQAEHFNQLTGPSMVSASSQGNAEMWLSPSQGTPPAASQGLPGGPQQQILFISPSTPRKLECDICHKQFSQRWYLNRHKVAHSGRYPHHCKYCNKGVFTKAHLENHISSHHQAEALQQNIAEWSSKTAQQNIAEWSSETEQQNVAKWSSETAQNNVEGSSETPQPNVVRWASESDRLKAIFSLSCFTRATVDEKSNVDDNNEDDGGENDGDAELNPL